MKKRTIIPTLISNITGGVILLCSVFGLIFNETKEIYPILLLMLSSIIIIISGVFSYFINDRLFGFVNLVGTILAFVAVRIFYVGPIENYTIPFILVLLCVLSTIFNFASVILSIYRLPVNQITFDNNLFKDVFKNQKTSLIFTLINSITLVIIIISLILNETNMLISIIVCILVLLGINFGKLLSFKFKNRIGSLIIFACSIILILGVNPQEFSVDNTCILLMLLEYVLSIILVLCEFFKFDDAVETKFGPKEYKK